MVGKMTIERTPDFEWHEYFKAMAEKGRLHPLFERLQPCLRPGMAALDLGCGIGHGTLHLLEQGLHVTSVDIHAEALERLMDRLPSGSSPVLLQSDLRDLEFESECFDVVVATNVLYFVSPEELLAFWPKLVGWIKPGGLFIGQFMGRNDSWSHREDYNWQTEETIRGLFSGFEILHLHDDEKESITVTGTPNHSHVFHVLARKLGHAFG